MLKGLKVFILISLITVSSLIAEDYDRVVVISEGSYENVIRIKKLKNGEYKVHFIYSKLGKDGEKEDVLSCPTVIIKRGVEGLIGMGGKELDINFTFIIKEKNRKMVVDYKAIIKENGEDSFKKKGLIILEDKE